MLPRSLAVLVALSTSAAASSCTAPTSGGGSSSTPGSPTSPARGPSASDTSDRATIAFDAPSRPFPSNRRSETAVAIDPSSPNVVAAGVNDLRDIRCRRPAAEPAPADVPAAAEATGHAADEALESETPAEDVTTADGCRVVRGGGISGVAFSFDGGSRWHQPTYVSPSGARTAGLPRYRAAGMSPHGDPAVAFGPLLIAAAAAIVGVRLFQWVP